METRAHHVLIGFFTLLVVGAALLFALWLGKGANDRQFDIYDIVFEEAVSGLSRGSTVEFNGIKIGDVDSLRLDPDDPRRVLARVRVDNTAPIRSDTRARLALAGVTGIAFIRLSSGNDPASTRLRPAPGRVPVIVATPSPISRILANGEDVMLNINEVMVQARALLSPENVGRVGRTLHHLEQTTATLAAQREDIGQLVHQLAGAGEQAKLALAEASRMLASTNRLIDGRGAQTLDHAQHALRTFEQTMQSVDGLIGDNRGALDNGLRGMAEIGPTLAELRTTLTALRSIAQQLEERPSNYLLGLEPMKEVQP